MVLAGYPTDARIDIFDPAVGERLFRILPTTKAMHPGNDGSLITFYVDNIPSSPWPQTIGGVPIAVLPTSYSSLRCLFQPPTLPFYGGNKDIILSVDDARLNHPTSGYTLATVRDMVTMVVDHLRANVPSIRVYHAMLSIEHHLYIFIQNNFFHMRDKISLHKKMAGYVGTSRVLYGREQDIGEWCAGGNTKRDTVPNIIAGVADKAAYEPLRPGVVIGSKTGMSATAETCTGVLVKNAGGRIYMTAASHGIGPTGDVFLPSRPEHIIGTVEADISLTDVCLISLSDDVTFENEPFLGDKPDVLSTLTRLASADDIRVGDPCYIETPFTGVLEGMAAGISIKVESSVPCNAYVWYFWGQEGETGEPVQPPDSSICGCPIWNENGVIYGFYHFYNDKKGSGYGMSLCAPASELTKRGFAVNIIGA